MANRVSNEQLEALLEFLQEHPSLAKGIGLGARSKETVDRQWKHLAMKLNSIGSGSSKTGERWKKYWADIKHKSKTRLSRHRQESFGTGGGPSTQEDISEMDKKILSVIGEEAVFGDVEYRVPIFNYTENTQMDTSQVYDQCNIDMSEVVICCEDSQTKNAPNLQTLSPSTRGQTSGISISETPENAASCSATVTQQIPGSTLHTGSESPVSRPVRDRILRPRYKSNNLHLKRPKTQSSIDPEWIKELEKCRVEAEARLANAASVMAEASHIQAEASANATGVMAKAFHELAEASKMQTETYKIQAEASANATGVLAKALKELAEASKIQAEASKIQAEASHKQAEALLIIKNLLPPKS